MNAQDLTLNIAVNLGRIARWTSEGKMKRIQSFFDDTETYLNQLDQADESQSFLKTYNNFRLRFFYLKENISQNIEWAEELFTWANILIHRAKLE